MRRGWCGLLLLLAAGCTRSHGSVVLMAPFSDDTVVGRLTVFWSDTGESRPGSAASAAERKVIFQVDAVNDLSDGLYLRLRDLQLTAHGVPIAAAGAVECRLAPGATPRLLAGALWVPASQAGAIGGFRIERFAVPLSARGQAFYREFLLRERPGAAAAIDAELAAYASAPPCSSAP